MVTLQKSVEENKPVLNAQKSMIRKAVQSKIQQENTPVYIALIHMTEKAAHMITTTLQTLLTAIGIKIYFNRETLQ